MEINDIADTKSTMILKGIPASLLRDPGSKCINTYAGRLNGSTSDEIKGEEVVAGYRAVKIATKDNWTWWYALDHGCALVKFRVEWGGNQGAF